MTKRFRTATVTAVALVLVGLTTAGCGRYSWSSLKAQKAYKDGNEAYKAQDWKTAATKYAYVLDNDPSRTEVYFFLGNSYDNQYKPSHQGEKDNDDLMTQAIANYRKSAELDKNPQMKKLALEYLVAAYGPEKLNDASQAEPIIQQMIQMEPNEVTNYFALAKTYEDAGKYDEAEATLTKARDLKPSDPTVYITMSNFYNRQGDFPKTIGALEKAADIDPKNPERHQLVATYYWEKAFKDHRLSVPQQKEYIQKGLDATDRAIALNADYSEALLYKNILLRMQANLETDMAKRQQLYKEADTLRNKAMDLNKKKASGT